ncbi:hypothetical protein AVEN_100269-1 [Araneus ventricosus]|uniref:Uncharacterized protein n=1 Tax=Araneus ventricosus TaxID=182803 RepID=A0A4Y2T869_ARAVE|nr:hypothetical protein AVEN_100269-1 [Araneus ventricosus]
MRGKSSRGYLGPEARKVSTGRLSQTFLEILKESFSGKRSFQKDQGDKETSNSSLLLDDGTNSPPCEAEMTTDGKDNYFCTKPALLREKLLFRSDNFVKRSNLNDCRLEG